MKISIAIGINIHGLSIASMTIIPLATQHTWSASNITLGSNSSMMPMSFENLFKILPGTRKPLNLSKIQKKFGNWNPGIKIDVDSMIQISDTMNM